MSTDNNEYVKALELIKSLMDSALTACDKARCIVAVVLWDKEDSSTMASGVITAQKTVQFTPEVLLLCQRQLFNMQAYITAQLLKHEKDKGTSESEKTVQSETSKSNNEKEAG